MTSPKEHDISFGSDDHIVVNGCPEGGDMLEIVYTDRPTICRGCGKMLTAKVSVTYRVDVSEQ